MPSPTHPGPVSAAMIFPELAKKEEVFVHAGRLVEIVYIMDDFPELEVLSVSAMRSRIMLPGYEYFRAGRDKNGKTVLRRCDCTEDDAKLLMATREARQYLPHLSILSKTQILTVDKNGKAKRLAKGYNRERGGVYQVGCRDVAKVELLHAVSALTSLVQYFRFATPGDKTRAIAGFFLPAIVYGQLLKDNQRSPMVIMEGTGSDSGKGLLTTLIAAVYNENPDYLANRNGGVGSFDEDFSASLLSGSPFVLLDNLRGKVDSQHIESFMTAEKRYYLRPVGKARVPVNPSHYVLFATSNGLKATTDLEERSLRILLKKRPKWAVHPECDGMGLPNYVRSRQPFYLGCVFAILEAWIEAGRPRTNETRHRFFECVQSLDWILQKYFPEECSARIMDYESMPSSENVAEALGFEAPDDDESEVEE